MTHYPYNNDTFPNTIKFQIYLITVHISLRFSKVSFGNIHFTFFLSSSYGRVTFFLATFFTHLCLLTYQLIFCGSSCCDRGKAKSTPSPKTDVWTSDWSLTIYGHGALTCKECDN